MTTRFIDHLLDGDHASRPSAGDVPQGTLYACSTHGLIYQSDGVSTWGTWATLGAPGATLTLPEGSAPSTPASGYGVAYFKTDGRMYSKDDAGTEYGPFDASGGGGPASYPVAWDLDQLPVDQGYEFAGQTALDGDWSLHGGASVEFPPDGAWLSSATAGDGMLLDITGLADFEAMLHMGTIKGSGEVMFGIGLLDSSGNGAAGIVYNDGNAYGMTVASYAYTGTGPTIGSNGGGGGNSVYIALKRVGTTVTFRIAGSSHTTLGSASSGMTVASGTQLFIGRIYNGAQINTARRVVIMTPDLGI